MTDFFRLHRASIFYLIIVGVLAACQPQEGTVTPAAPAKMEATTELAAQDTDAKAAPSDEADNPFSVKPIEFPENTPALGWVDSRKAQSLNGDWSVIVDPMDVGAPGSIFGGFVKNKTVKTGMELIEYDFEAADTLRVPGDWNSQEERLFFYQGIVWYSRTFEVSPTKGTRQHLWFGGANFDAQIFLNGEPVGRHQGGYVSFSYDVTERLNDGENRLMVRVDNRLSDQTVPTKRTDWWPYGGLTRDVMLVETPRAYIENAKLVLVDREARQIRAEVQTVKARKGTPVTVSFQELAAVFEGEVDARGRAVLEFSVPVELWSPDSPKLYDVEITLGQGAKADQVQDRIGFRTIETQGRQILLNGEAITLRGISTHEEPIGEAGVAYSAEHAQRLLAEVKALNANFVRAAHYPYSRHMAHAADEMGVMMWAEIPVYWNIDWENTDTLESAQNMLSRLIHRDWNRASVIIWSVANETPYSEPRMAFLETLIDKARAWDDSRLVSAALLGGGREDFETVMTHLAVRGLAKGGLSKRDWAVMNAIKLRAGLKAPKASDGLTVTVKDPLAKLVDIIAYNEYFGWYYSVFFSDATGIGEDVLRPLMLDLMLDMRLESEVEKPIHVSEFGAGAKYGTRHTGEGTPHIWSEDYQAEVYKAQLEMLANSPQVQGLTPWVLKDFRAMLRPLAGVQDYYNRKGLLDPEGQRKLAFDVLREHYEELEGEAP